MMNTTQKWKLLLCAAAVSMAGACSDDEDGDKGGTLDSGVLDGAVVTPDGGGPPADGSLGSGDGSAPVTPTGSKYAVVTQVSVSGDQTTSYVSVVDSLSNGVKVSLDGATQVNGRALAANEAGSGVVFVSTGGAPELTRYELRDGNKLEATGKISFQDRGVQSIGEYATQLQFVSPTKAYYFDTRTAQIIVWNPMALTVTSAIDIKSLTLPDATLTFTSALAIRRGTQIVLPAGWRSGNNQRVIKQASVVVLDTATDTAKVLTDTRCGYVRDGVEGADGHVYVATEAWGSSVYRLNTELAPAPCLLRLKQDLSGYDESYYKELNSLAGAPTGSLVKSIDGKVYTRVLDEAAAGINAMTSARALASLPVWKWAEISLGDAPTVSVVAGAPISTGSLIVLDARDKRFIAEIKTAGTDLVEITQGIGGVAAQTSGLTFSAVLLK